LALFNRFQHSSTGGATLRLRHCDLAEVRLALDLCENEGERFAPGMAEIDHGSACSNVEFRDTNVD
jgi:hypothetical protein